jgi:hypothetical protein
MLKDYWGNDALDFGTDRELENKYPNEIFVSVTDRPFGSYYVLFKCNSDEYEKAESFLEAYRSGMALRGITSYGVGISLGANLLAEQMDGFQGGVNL